MYFCAENVSHNHLMPHPDFVAIDFEFATSSRATICSVGIVSFKDGEVIDQFYSLVQPPGNRFDWQTIRVHKIKPSSTANAPTFPEIFPEIIKRIQHRTVVAHDAFNTDKVSLEQAMRLNRIHVPLKVNWVCSQKICNTSLKIAAKALEITLSHHNALSDAYACGAIYARHLAGNLPIERIEQLKEERRLSRISIRENEQGESTDSVV
jgi:DNA polymerase III subunit epsilon